MWPSCNNLSILNSKSMITAKAVHCRCQGWAALAAPPQRFWWFHFSLPKRWQCCLREGDTTFTYRLLRSSYWRLYSTSMLFIAFYETKVNKITARRRTQWHFANASFIYPQTEKKATKDISKSHEEEGCFKILIERHNGMKTILQTQL